MTPVTWLVVLTWNGREDTLALLDSLRFEPATVLVVDNGSNDGTLRAVRESFPDVHTLQTGENLGYTGGNNAGIDHALASGAEVIGVLNNDTVVEPGFLEPLLEALAQHDPAAVSPDIRYFDDPDTSWFRGSRIDDRTGWPHHLGPADQPPADGPPVESPVLTGCGLLATARTWRTVGLFDDGFFLNFEDSDWSRRAADRGVTLLVVPRSLIRHRVSRSFVGAAGALGSYYFARNGTVFARRYLGFVRVARFVLSQILRPCAQAVIRPEKRPEAVMLSLGLLAALSGHRGPAGRLATRYARRSVARHG